MKLRIISPFLFLFLEFLPVHSALAQIGSASVHGFVKDAKSGETLIRANVFINETLSGTATNNSGYYTIANIEPGRFTLVASYIGYERFKKELAFAPGQELRLDIELRPSVIETEEVIIESEMLLEEERPVGVLNVQPRLVRELPAVLEADLFRSIQLLPGIKAASDFSTGLYIRGGSPDQTLTLIDQTTVYNPSHFFGFFSTFNPDAIKDVRIYKGGYPAEYGGRLGSVIDIYNRDGNRKEFQGRISMGLLASRINVEGPLSRGSWMLAARRSTLEPLLAVLRSNIDDVPNVFYFYDLNGKINYDAGSNDQLNFAFYDGSDKVEFPFADDAKFDLEYGNRTLSTNWTHIFSKKVFSKFTLTSSRYFNYPRIKISGTPVERDNKVSDISVKGDIEYVGSGSHQLKSGFWLGGLTLTIKNRFDKEEILSERIKTQYGSIYVQESWRPNVRWLIKGGLRVNFMAEGNYLRFEPRLSVEHISSQDLLIQAAFGRYYQFLTLITNEAFSGFDTWLTTDDGVPPSWGDQVVLGVKTRPGEGYHFDVELYYRTMRDLFELDPRIPDPAGLDYEDLFRFGRGFAYGVEFYLEKERGRLFGFLGYTWSKSRRRFPSYNNDRYYPPKYDRIHDVNLVMNYRLSKKWRATAVFNYATGQAYTPVLGSYYVQTPTASVDKAPFIVGNLNASRLPGYHRFDVGFIRFGSFFGIGDYQLQLQIINVYSRRNLWFYSYDLDENPILREDVRMLPIIPNVSFTLDF
ncbi:MAG: TonB-dependent receptor [bacterium]